MARVLKGDEDIDTNLIIGKSGDTLNDMEHLEMQIDIKKGLKYLMTTLTGNINHAEEEFIRAHNLTKKTKAIEEEEQKGKQDVGIKEFLYKDEYENDNLEPVNKVLPYRTIDVIFNKKNIFLNMQNPSPVGILYDLYNKERWYPLLKIKEGAQEAKDIKVWKQDIPAFYSFKSFNFFFFFIYDIRNNCNIFFILISYHTRINSQNSPSIIIIRHI